ncbi:hypothetical protein [Rhizobium sp. MHM7A]|uniref:hypothetical protein n=1 Tax=Rhizobium sp. MHM7A TaxID=2583233 RepID=UPI001107172F|nr:hypothetical protein [Rhizobium sp. MHM7A]TLX15894.1 hypothetical protein FFR93_00850 [Rhizobium sp. MHM7A]
MTDKFAHMTIKSMHSEATDVWEKLHQKSERLASRADLTAKKGRITEAELLYAQAATFEAAALLIHGNRTPRTTGILAVSAAALFSKAGRPEDALWISITLLPSPALPKFARDQLEEIRFLNTRSARKAS